MKTIVITGASSGIGKATARHFAAQGWQVAATMRKPEKETELSVIDGIRLYQLDVTQQASIDSATAQILAEYGTVDVVLNNAGYGLVGVFEATTPEQIHRQFNTNVFGLMAVTRAFLPHFRANKAGMFINVSSLGGLITYPFTSLYHSTKWAVEGFSESLAFELGELGIQVKLVEPGAVATDFSGRSMEFAMPDELPDYLPAAQKFMAAQANSNRVPATAEQIAEGIYAAATDGQARLRYPLGDAPQTVAMHSRVGEEAFIAGIRQRMFG
ncbi:MAG: short-chain dehydrogenase [Anaerolineae bacterium SG8_19]|jgi:NAD(P)-dependent dehydrogenase (short-subunit alcohol dehydrogenase family)|nr:MAG: short-chain dehydrogenase [Anaerolineae bacterium SG8_19]